MVNTKNKQVNKEDRDTKPATNNKSSASADKQSTENKTNKKKKKKQMMKRKKLKLSEESNDLPRLVPTIGPGYNLNKRLLADIYLKELTHSIYLVWVDSLYDNEFNLDDIYLALKPLIRNGADRILTEQNIFINATDMGDGNLVPAGSCFVLLPVKNIGPNENIIRQKITKNRAKIVKVALPMLRQHISDKLILILSAGHKSLIEQVPPQYIKPVGSQEDLRNILDRSKSPQPSTEKQESPQVKTKKKQVIQQPETLAICETEKNPKLIGANGNIRFASQETQDHPGTSSHVIDVSQSLKPDDYDSDVQIIEPPLVQQRQIVSEPEPPAKVFVPVTENNLYQALALMSKYESQKRAVAIVFDSCFFLEDIGMDLIRKKFTDIFGRIDENQVLIRVNMPRLPVNLDEAKKMGIKNMNQAYIIGQQGLTDNDINRRAAARGVFCCPMTLGCVVNNLKRGVFLLHTNVLNNRSIRGEPSSKRSIKNESSNDIPELNTSNNSNGSSKGSSSGRRTSRIAAALGADSIAEIEPKSDEVSEAGMVQYPVEEVPPLEHVTDRFLNHLKTCGNSVLRIENLPAKLSVVALNLMMGTFTIKAEQVLASLRPSPTGRNHLMDVRIVIMRDNEDVIRILRKNGLRTCYNTMLKIEMTNHHELKEFIRTSYGSLRKLDSTINLTMNQIGYSTAGR